MRVLWAGTETPVKLDKKDERILREIANDARRPIARVAKSVGLSPQGTQYRIDRMREREILVGTRVAFNYAALGLSSYHIFLAVPRVTKEMITQLSSHPNISAVIQYLGRWDLEIVVFARTPEQLQKVREAIAIACGNPADERVLLMLSTIVSVSFPAAKITTNKSTTTRIPDAIDVSLLRAISENADAPIGELATTSNLTRDQVAYRLRTLVDGGIIREFRHVVNFGALGYGIHAVLLRCSAPVDEKGIRSALVGNNCVLWAARTLGDCDVACYLMTRNQLELAGAISTLKERLDVARCEVLTAHVEHKYTYAPALFEP